MIASVAAALCSGTVAMQRLPLLAAALLMADYLTGLLDVVLACIELLVSSDFYYTSVAFYFLFLTGVFVLLFNLISGN